MLRTHLSGLVAIFFLLGISLQPALAGQQNEKQKPASETADSVKIQISKLGLGEKAKATIRLKDGKKVKGYVGRTGDDDFVIRDRKTDTPTTIHYIDVARVERNGGHSTARNVALGLSIGAAGAITTLLLILAHG